MLVYKAHLPLNKDSMLVYKAYLWFGCIREEFDCAYFGRGGGAKTDMARTEVQAIGGGRVYNSAWMILVAIFKASLISSSE